MTKWSTGHVTTNGINLHYYRTGGDKPPLVLSHGITDNGLCWTRAALVLQEDYDVIMVDARGHGQSDKPDGEYSSTVHAADLAGLIEGLGLAAPRIMGHSMGAGTATALAAIYPALVSRVVLEDPPWRAMTGDEQAGNAEERAAAMAEWKNHVAKQQELPQEEIAVSGRQQNPKWDESEFEPWSLAKKQVSLNVFAYRMDIATHWLDAVAKITCPILLVTADPDEGAIVTPETAAAAAAANPNVEVAQIANAGHNIRRDNFEQFMQTIQAFLR